MHAYIHTYREREGGNTDTTIAPFTALSIHHWINRYHFAKYHMFCGFIQHYDPDISMIVLPRFFHGLKPIHLPRANASARFRSLAHRPTGDISMITSYLTIHYITLHYTTLHYITLPYITLHTYICINV